MPVAQGATFLPHHSEKVPPVT